MRLTAIRAHCTSSSVCTTNARIVPAAAPPPFACFVVISSTTFSFFFPASKLALSSSSNPSHASRAATSFRSRTARSPMPPEKQRFSGRDEEDFSLKM